MTDSWEGSLEADYDALVAEGGQTRDERGRFAAAELAEPIEAVETEETVETEEPVEAEEAAEPTEPVWKPASWKAEELAGWEALPAHARAAIERRETEINRGLQAAASERQIARTIQQIAAPYEPQLRAVGIDPVGAFQESLNLFSQLNTGTPEQRAAVVHQIAQRYGVQLGGELGAATPAVDPALSATQQQLAALQQQVTRWQTTQQQTEQQQAVAQIEAFGKDVAHPHFESVRDAMADLIQSGTARDLQDAYDKAIWLVPEVRTKLISETEVKRQQEAARRASEARRAGAVNVSARGAPAAQAPKAKNWVDDLDRTYDEVTNHN